MPSVLPFGPSVRTASGDIAESLGSAEKSQVQEALSGDAAAFETVVRLYSRRVYAVAYAITQDVAEAEDIVQETFLKAYQNRQRLREAEKFLPWLQTVARNGARDRLRKRRPQATPETFETLVDHQSERPGTTLEHREDRARLRQALEKLPEDHRIALTLLYLEGFDYQSIQTRMGLSNGALRGILGRALGSLRRNPALHPAERKIS